MTTSFFRPPFRLAIIHTALIVCFMFTLWNGWFVSEPPYDCGYVPFLLCSGPAYLVAHYVQHQAERYCSHAQVAWNLVPGVTCLALGGLEWIVIESLWTGASLGVRRVLRSDGEA